MDVRQDWPSQNSSWRRPGSHGGRTVDQADPTQLAAAYVLAGQLHSGDDTAAAIARYQARLQGVIVRNQKHTESLVASFVPRTEQGVRLRDYATLLMRLPVFPRLLMWRYFRDEMVLPEYGV